MYRVYDQNQHFLLPPSLQDFVNEDHPNHMINDLVDQLGLSVLEARYGSLGQPAYRPHLMLKVVLAGFTMGIFGGGGVDKFRIKILDKDAGDGVVYDNQMAGADDDDPVTAINGGSVKVHKGN